MGKHWNPQDELLRVREDRDSRRQSGPRWPDGATAGLVTLGFGCLAVALLFYRLAGPRDVFSP